MKNTNDKLLYNILSLVCGLWFLATGWMWTYLINLIISYPIGIIGFLLWRKGKNTVKKDTLNLIALITLIIGLFCSVVALFLYK